MTSATILWVFSGLTFLTGMQSSLSAACQRNVNVLQQAQSDARLSGQRPHGLGGKTSNSALLHSPVPLLANGLGEEGREGREGYEMQTGQERQGLQADEEQERQELQEDKGQKGQEREELQGHEGHEGQERQEIQGYERQNGQERQELQGHEGQKSQGNGGYGSQGHEGYESQGHEGYESQGHEGYESQGHGGYESQGHEGYESQGYEGYESQEHEGRERQGPERNKGQGPEGQDMTAREKEQEGVHAGGRLNQHGGHGRETTGSAGEGQNRAPHQPPPSSYPFRNVSLPWGARVDNLVSLLTLGEVQLQMARGGHGRDVSPAPPIRRLGVGPYSWNTECLRGVVNAGPATSFPQALGLAATFSPDLVGRVARATGLEVRAKYNNYTRHGVYGDHKGLSCFSPVINIMRDPRWGRNQETYGEDPYLTSQLAHSFVKGLQGNDSRYVLANAGCKHFDAHGGPENVPVSRFSFNAKVTDQDWHQTFLPAFKACVEAGAYSLMCSYNSINGVPACANNKLLTEILRDSWGFSGYVVSDQSALERIVTDHHYVKDDVTAAARAINAGVSLEVSRNDVNGVFMQLLKAMKKGLVKETTLHERVKPLFYTRMRLGEFDPPSMNPYSDLDLSLIQSPAHQALSLEAAMKSFVLLKNDDGFLPITKKFNRVAVVGPMSDNATRVNGDPTKSPTVNVTASVTPLQGLRHIGNYVTHAEGCDDVSCNGYDRNNIKAAVEKSDLVFVCLGTGHLQESEMHDKVDLELPGQQSQLLRDAINLSAGAPVVLLLFNAGPLNVTWADRHASVSAILECFFPAQSAGRALLRVVTNEGGSSSPAGRLPNTWPLTADQIPPMVNYSMAGRTYRYSQTPALYPFGFGLSYSTFRYSHLALPSSALTAGQPLRGSVMLHNTGRVISDEVVQVYVQWSAPSLPAPRLQLVWVDRLTAAAGSSRRVHFTVEPRSMALWLSQGWTISPGSMTVYVGGQQPGQAKSAPSNVLSATFTIHGTKFLGKY